MPLLITAQKHVDLLRSHERLTEMSEVSIYAVMKRVILKRLAT